MPYFYLSQKVNLMFYHNMMTLDPSWRWTLITITEYVWKCSTLHKLSIRCSKWKFPLLLTVDKWVEQILGMGEDGGKFVLQQLK